MLSKIVYHAIYKCYRLADKIHCNRAKARMVADFWKAHDEQAIHEASFFPEEEHKPFCQIQTEINNLFYSGLADSTPGKVFNAYMMLGLDCRSRDVQDYLFETEFKALVAKHRPSYAKMLNNKIYTLVYLAARGIPVSEILGQVDDDGMFHSMDGKSVANFHDWMAGRSGPVFCKQPDGYQGTSCFVLELREGQYFKSGQECTRGELDALLPQLQIETVIEQHPDMAAIYPDSVNTCRIVTVAIRGKVQFFSGYALFGCNGARVSNGCSGGILLPFDESGILGPYGVRERAWGGGAYVKHPDTGTIFADCRIPYFSQVIQLAIRAHETMPTIRSVGWDVAITPTGPVIIEGNQGWICAEHQIFRGGLRKKAMELLG